jgi:catechol 2,3-dioxygenase-like lactoylglutathione lyase family enzyme
MSLKHVLGADHVVIAVRDLDASAAQWRRMGFTLSHRGTHSRLMGTANYTIMFGEDYLELLGVLAATDQNKPTQQFLQDREGIERMAFTTDDAAAGAAELRSQGLAPLGPVQFSRPVDLPGGEKSEAKFNVFRWPLNENPGGMRIFACQHLTRSAVWVPGLQNHANGASCIRRIEILSATPKTAAEHLGRLIDEPVTPSGDSWRVPSGRGRADVLFFDQAAFAHRYPQAVRLDAAREGAVAIVIGITALAAATKALESLGISHDGVVSVPAAAANGVIVSFLPQ